jgi:hypothetical protein
VQSRALVAALWTKPRACVKRMAMTQDTGKPSRNKPVVREKDLRDARRKEALKANMARRKAQVRARGDAADGATETGPISDSE